MSYGDVTRSGLNLRWFHAGAPCATNGELMALRRATRLEESVDLRFETGELDVAIIDISAELVEQQDIVLALAS